MSFLLVYKRLPRAEKFFTKSSWRICNSVEKPTSSGFRKKKIENVIRLQSFWIRTPVTFMRFRTTINSEMRQKIASLNFRTALMKYKINTCKNINISYEKNNFCYYLYCIILLKYVNQMPYLVVYYNTSFEDIFYGR